jgi:site-specific DNA-cytosine methylase
LQHEPSALPQQQHPPLSEFSSPEAKRQKLLSSTPLPPLEPLSTHDDTTPSHALDSLIGKLRYFTPEELLRLFGFLSPDTSSSPHPTESFFPLDETTLTNRKKYELIGNSLNVTVASCLLQFLFEVEETEGGGGDEERKGEEVVHQIESKSS